MAIFENGKPRISLAREELAAFRPDFCLRFERAKGTKMEVADTMPR